MQTFVEAVHHHTQQYESPSSFWKWSAYASISAVLRDNVYLLDGDSRIYPNIYTIFLAGSAQRKARPVNLAEHLVYEVNNVKVISGRSSIQAILIDIAQTETDRDTGILKKGGSAFFVAPELSAGLVADDQSIQILTDIYDYKPIGHTTNLVGRGKTRLDKLVFSMFGASNEELMKDIYNSKAIHGGLLGRTFLVMPDEFRPSNAFPEPNEEGFKHLVSELKKVSKLDGAVIFTPEARKFYEDWYIDYREKSRKRDDKTGIIGRLPANAKKLAMIFAANELSVTITKENVEAAVDECVALIPNYSAFVFSAGKSTVAECGAIVLDELSRETMLTRKEIIRRHWMDFDIEILDKTVAALEAGGSLQTTMARNDISYILTARGKEIFGIK